MKRYDLTAEMYDERYSEEQKRKYKKALENVTVAHKKVLDVGCGSGLFLQEVAAATEIFVGVDVSSKLLHKTKLQARAFQNAFVLRADADHLPFMDGFFEVIFAFTMLQNLPKPPETLHELKRVSMRNGCVVVTGLKKAFSLNTFMDFLEGSGMKVTIFVDEDEVNCYVAILISDSYQPGQCSLSEKAI